MNADDPIDFLSVSGRTYRYWLLNQPETASAIKAEGGNYAFVRQMPDGRIVPLYFGKSDNLRGRIPCHEVWSAARRLGVTHVLAHTTPSGDEARLVEECDLIAFWNPVLNVQHRTVV